MKFFMKIFKMKFLKVMLMFLLAINGFLPFLQPPPVAHAATLSSGDMVVYGIDAVNNDFYFATLVDIPAGTVIKMTDRAWYNQNAFTTLTTYDGLVTWTLTNAISKGTLFRLGLPGLSVVALTDLSSNTDISSQIVSTGFSVADPMGPAGDNLFIYQDANSNPYFIFGMNNAESGVDTSNWGTNIGISAPYSSKIPSGTNSQNALANGTNAIGLPGNTDQKDIVFYTGPVTITDASTWLSRMTNGSNWTGSDTSGSISSTISNSLSIGTNTAPTFIGTTTTLSVDQNASASDIKSLLHVSDVDSNQTITWSQNIAPIHGTLSFASATASSGGADLTPGGTITYQPTTGYIGSDSFTVQVSDGITTATQTITVTVNDITAPTLSNLGSSSITTTSASVSGTSDEAGTLYYVITTRATMPSAAQVIAGQDDLGSAAIQSGSTSVTATVASSFNVTGLSNGTAYYAYFVAKDSVNNSSSVGTITFATLSTNVNLSALTLSTGTLSPTFAIGTTSYTASVNYNTTSLTVTPTKEQSGATIQVQVNSGGYSSVTSGVASASLSLSVGSNTIDVRVTAEDGTTLKTYSITVTRAANAAPVASSVSISGTVRVGQTVTGNYTYSDEDADAEGTSTYNWYRADDTSGTNQTAISGANATTYVIQSADVGKYIRFQVTPVASAGTVAGTAVQSSSVRALIATSAIYSHDSYGFSGVISTPAAITTPLMNGYKSWPSGFVKTSSAFASGVYDGTNVWLIPYRADRVIKLNTSTGEMTGYNSWPSGFTRNSGMNSNAFMGGVFDGSSIWLVPNDANQVIKLNPSTGAMTGYSSWPSGYSTLMGAAFSGGVFDGKSLWMIPLNANRVVKVDVSTGAMTGYNSWPSGFVKSSSAFYGGIYDGTSIWMVPSNADRVIKLDVTTGVMTGYNTWPSGFTKQTYAFNGGVYDGTNLWMLPYNADRMIKMNLSTGEMTGYNSWPSGMNMTYVAGNMFTGGIYDGTNIWAIPYNSNQLVKVNPTTGEMTGYTNWPSGVAKALNGFWGGVNDGRNFWMIPYTDTRVIKISNVNSAPTDITLSTTTIAENNAMNATVGTLSASDIDVGDTATFTLVSGTGDTDNASFSISGTSLKTASSFDFETKSSYSVRIQVTDSGSATYEKQFTITVTDANDAPTDVGLSSATIAENSSSGTTVGTLNNTDVDTGNTYTYMLVSGTGDTDNASFTISGTTLETAASFDYETKSSYSIRVNVNDGSNDYEKQFTITVTDANDAPTDVGLSSATIAENSSSGTTVGTISNTDADSGNTYTYTLVSGTGDTDNASFTISGTTLETAASFNYESKSSYSIRVNVNDGSNDYEKQFTINVTDVNEAPTDIGLSASSIAENSSSGTTVGTLSNTDVDSGNTYTYTLVSGTGDTDNASFTISGTTLQTATSLNYETKSSYSIRVNVNDGSNNYEKQFTITVTDVNEAPTDIGLSTATIAENSLNGTSVGTLSNIDVDSGNTYTYTLVSGTGDTDNTSFTISGTSLQTAASFDYETKSSYSIRVNVNDGTNDYEKQFTITVTDANEAPTDIGLSTATIAENSLNGTSVGTLSNIDVDSGNTYTYTLVSGTGDTDNASFTISGTSLLTATTLDYESKSSYSIRMNVNDGTNDYEKQFTITVTDVNEAPTDIGLSASSIAENSSSGTTVGTLSNTDVDSGNTYTYTLVSGTGDTDNASFTISGTTLQTATSLNYETKSSYSIRVNVNDGSNNYEKQIAITVTDVNEAPTDIGLSTATISENSSSGSTFGTLSNTDVDSGNTYTYTLVSGTGDTDNASFTISGTTLLTATSLDYESKSSYSIRVNVNDGTNDYAKQLTISVSDANEAPTDIALSASSIAENSSSSSTVGTLSNTDIDSGNTYTYTHVSGTGDTDNASFTISGTLLQTAASLDYESKSSYSIRVNVNDGSNNYEKQFTITVTDVNEAPTDIALSASSIVENSSSSSSVGTLSNTDVDSGNTYTYTLASGTGDTDNSSFTISGTTLQTAISLDYESKSSYSIRVNVNDGTNNYEKQFTITVTDVNEAPTDISLSASSIAENSTSGTPVGTLSNIDVDSGNTYTYTLVSGTGDTDNVSFTISGNSLLTATNLDYESKSSYSIRVNVNDGSNNYEKQFTITVTDVNEAPTNINLSSTSVAENSSSGSTVGTLSNTDVDSGNTYTYTLVSGTGDTDNVSFTISGNSLLTATNLDYESKSSYSIRVNVNDGSNNYEKQFTITVTDVNEAPTNINLSSTSVAENSSSGSTVGTLNNTDVDSGNTYTYTLVSGTGDTDNVSFTISGNSLLTATNLDYESKSSYSIRVNVNDGSNNYEKQFTITVTDVNEAPTNINLSSTSVAENSSSGSTVGTLNNTDVDSGNTYTYTLVSGTGDTDNVSFTISGNSLLTATNLDYESKSSYSIRVNVNDGSNNYEKQFTITVTDVNEAPTNINLSSTSVAENSSSGSTVGTLNNTDVDSGNTYTYTFVSGTGDTDNASFAISGTTLQTAASFDYETKSSYSIRVNVNDGLNDCEKQFTITVTDVNEAPTNLSLSNSSVSENSPSGTTVGTLSNTDVDSGNTFTYTFVSGAGDTDNASFTISGTSLLTAESFNYESKSSYSIRVNVDDGLNGYEKQFTITVLDVNEAPTNLSLSTSSVSENSLTITSVGTLSNTDVDSGNTYTYTLVSGTGSTDNASFTISGTSLLTSASFDYETKSSYSIRANVNDGLNDYEQQFTITVTDVNEAPTNLSLSNSSVSENSPSIASICTLSNTDVDSGNTYTYTFVSGTGDTDNASFTISGTTLQTAASFDYETKSSYSIRVNVNDGSNDYEKQFTITVTDVNEAPTNLSLSNSSVSENSPSITSVGTLSNTDVDSGNTYTYTLVSGTGSTDNASFTISGTSLLTAASFDYETKLSYSIRVNVNDGSNDYEKQFTITVLDVNEAPTNLSLSNSNVSENSPSITSIGTLSNTDVDSGNTYTYTLVSGTGSTDNASFTISGTSLLTAASFDYETKLSYSIRVNVNDGSNDYEKQFTITVLDVNEAPTNLSLSNSNVSENSPSITSIGTLSNSDVDSGNTYTYTFVSGTGDTDNASFTISGTSLVTSASFDYETKPSYSIRVNVNDGSNDYEKQITITVTDVNEAPTNLSLSNSSVSENSLSITSVGTFSNTDVDSGNTYTYTFVSGTGDTDNASFTISGTTLQTATSFDYETKSSYSIRVNVNDGSNNYEKQFMITVTDVNEAPIANNGSLNVSDETVTSGTLSGQDIEQQTVTYAIVTQGSKGNVTITDASTGAYTYTPNAGSEGSDQFTFKVTDQGGLDSGLGVISVTIALSNYLVDFNNGGGSAVTSQSIAFKKKASKPLDPSKSGYTFKGWYKDQNGTLPFDFGTVQITQATTVYANWTLVQAPIVVSFPAYEIAISGGEQVVTNNITPTISGTTNAPNGTLVSITVAGQTGSASVSNGKWSWNVLSGIADGDYIATAKVSNTQGLESTDQQSIQMDATAYRLTIDSMVLNRVTTDKPILTGTTDAPNGSIVSVKVDGKSYEATVAGGNWSIKVTDSLPNGTYTVYASITDSSGNQAIATQLLSVDVKLPSIAIYNAPTILTNDPTPNINGFTDASNGSAMTIEVNGAKYATTVANGKWEVTITTPLADGSYVVNAYVIDLNGKKGSAVPIQLTINTSKAELKIAEEVSALKSDPRPQLYGTTNLQDFVPIIVEVINASESIVSSQKTSTLSGQWSIKPANDLADGTYTVRVSATEPTWKQVITDQLKLSIETKVDYKLTLSASPKEMFADGKSQSMLSAYAVDPKGKPLAGVTIHFTVGQGTLSTNDVTTDEQGVASALLTSPVIEALEPEQIVAKATISTKDNIVEDNVSILLLPAAIEGYVRDAENGQLVEGAKVTISEDFNHDGTIDFEAVRYTSSDGYYTITVPKGNYEYHPVIEFSKKMNGKEIKLSFEQNAQAGDVGEQGKSFLSENTIGGQLLFVDSTSGETVKMNQYSHTDEAPKLSASLVNSDGSSANVEVNPDGSYRVTGVEKGKTYEVLLTVVASTGEELAGTKVKLTVGQEGEIAFSTTLIDPYGIVKDAATGKVISGVHMKLWFADTETNRTHGRTGGSPVILPILAGFKPNDNKMPQFTDVHGEYAWMVFPDADYYITAEKDGYITYDSRNEKRNVAQLPGEDSYIKDGIIHVGQTIVNYDLELDSVSVPIKVPMPTETKVEKHTKYISGYPGAKFKPNKWITRAELAVLLSRWVKQSGYPINQSKPTEKYRDLGHDQLVKVAIESVTKYGFMTHYKKGKFGPNKFITNKQMKEIIHNVLTVLKKQIKNNYHLNELNKYLSGQKMAGTPHVFTSKFLNRAQTVVILNRLFQRGPITNVTKQTWTDVPKSNWAYAEIEEASQDHQFVRQADDHEKLVKAVK